ncbi:MAG: hypothetical protein AN490_20945 [Anabaena sp. AL09]|nr:MAG: hypothetical protein AN490_20945 [Anabaena sp. AL09]
MIKHPFNISKTIGVHGFNLFENIKTSNPIGVGVSGIFYRKYHKGSGRATGINTRIIYFKYF